MNQSPTIGALAAALAAAQAESKRPAMSGINPAFKKDGHGTAYSTMTDYREAASVLAKHKIAVVQAVSTREGNVVDVETMLLHESGEWLSAITSIAANDGRAQSVAGAATYGKRIGISAMIFESGDPDDDGNAASAVQSGVESRPAQRYTPKPQGVEAAKDLIVAHKNIKAAQAMLHPDAHALDERRRSLWTRLKDLGMPAGAAADWVKSNRVSHGTELAKEDFDKMEGLVAAIEKGAVDKTDVNF